MRTLTLLLAVACRGTETTPATRDGDDDDDVRVDSADSAPSGPEPKLAAEVRFRALIAWDQALGAVVDPILNGDSSYISAYLIELFEEGWSNEDEASSCLVAVELAGTPLSPYATVDGYLFGFDIPFGLRDKVVFSDCLEKGFDASQFVAGDPVESWGPYDWSLRFGGELSEELATWLTPDPTTTGFDLSHYAAANWWSETAPFTTEPDGSYWYAYAMSATHDVDFDTLLHDYEMTDGTGAPVTAYFVFDQRVYWNLEPPAR